MFRLSTVARKLIFLVALSGVAAAVTLLILFWVMPRQLLDEVDDRVEDAQRSFQSELEDDLADLTIAARVLASNPATNRGIGEHDAAVATRVAQQFLSVYPDIDVVLADADGKVVAQLGCSVPPATLADLPEVPTGKAFRGIVHRGCEARDGRPVSALVISEPIVSGGTVAVLEPLDVAFAANASAKLGLELQLEPNGTDVVRTASFPPGAEAVATSAPVVYEREMGGKAVTWAIDRFEPKGLAPGALHVIAALDVTDIQHVVRTNLWISVAILLFAVLGALAYGGGVASTMSRGLSRVSAALKRLEQDEYVHVDDIRTGDELEDLATGFNTMVDGLKDAKEMREKYGKYLTASLIDALHSGKKVELGGTTLEASILFSDIRSFTTISEQMDAQALVALLNEYFTDMVEIVLDEGGVVDKYIGDAIMAVYGGTAPGPDDALHAVRSAVRMRGALVKLNERLVARGLEPLRIGIGVHSGIVVAGNIGSDQHMSYTVIGDAVNLASRLETATKELGEDVVISEDAYARVKDKVKVRALKEITVKGRVAPVMTYAVTDIS
jgi:adenylate cyclase